MPHRYTTDPSEKAFSIAEREAEEEYKKKGDPAQYFKTIEDLYYQVLKELVWEPERSEYVFNVNLQMNVVHVNH